MAVLIDGSKLQYPQSDVKPASISDSEGRLLFYSGAQHNSGGTLSFDPTYNGDHEIMKNGESSIYSVISWDHIILPIPGDTNMFYLIKTNRGIPDTGLCTFVYDIIDVSKQNGFGEVIKKDTSTGKPYPHDPIIEVCAIFKHSNNLDSWFLTWQYNFDNQLEYHKMYAYLFDSKGVKDTVYSSIKKGAYGWNFIETGHDNKEFLMAYKTGLKGETQSAVIFNFNSTTGIATEKRTFKICDSCGVIEAEYSPDGKKLFFSLHNHTRTDTINFLGNGSAYLAVFDLEGNSEEIANSKRKIGRQYDYYNQRNGYYMYGDIKAGPNGKIYTGLVGSNKLLSIDNPNAPIEEITITEDAVDLKGKQFYGDFPLFLPNYYNVHLELLINTPVCQGESINLRASLSDTLYERIWHWAGPNGFESDEQNPIVPNASLEHSGWYVLKATVNGAELFDSVYVEVQELSKPEITGANTAFLNETKLYRTPNTKKAVNLWTAVGGDIIGSDKLDTVNVKWTIKGEGKVILEQFFSEFECKGYSELLINITDWNKLTIQGDDAVCLNDTTEHTTAYHSDINYSWSVDNGVILSEEPNKITVHWPQLSTGKIELISYNQLTEQRDTTELTIIINENPPKPGIKQEGKYLVTEEYDSHQWFLNGVKVVGETRNFITPKENGKYQVIVTDSNGCRSDLSDEFDYILSVDDEIMLSVISPNPASDYIEINLNYVMPAQAGIHNLSVKVYDVLGNVVVSESFTHPLPPSQEGELSRIDISSLNPGVYFVKVGSKVSKFVKI